MLSSEESLKILKETKALIEGHFILSSGLHSPKYVQCAKLMSKPSQAAQICQSLVEKIKNETGISSVLIKNGFNTRLALKKTKLKRKTKVRKSHVTTKNNKPPPKVRS
mgnify:CR=1 FL=1